jgi:preprotein translocase subunit YajC
VPVPPSSILAASTAKGNSGGSGFLLVVLFGLVLFFLFRRSQRNARKRADGAKSSIVVGSRVITTSGMYATVVAVDDATYDLEVDDDVIITFAKAAVTRLAPVVDAEETGPEDTGEHDHDHDSDHDHDDVAPAAVLLEKPQSEDPARSSSES